MRITVIGVGLIGGSIALAARQRTGAEVAAYDSDPAALDAATELGAIDHRANSPQEALTGADAAFLAVPVGALPATLEAVLTAAPPTCVVSDVGSTKRAIVAAHQDQRFVGGHPLAGAETSGVAHARADLFEGATWYLTPARETSGVLYERLHRLISSLGARPQAIEADAHDAVMALVSHLPHVLANVLVTQAARTLSGQDDRLPAVGPSFRDATRVAGASSAIWTDIYMSNRSALIDQIDATIDRLQEARATLAAGQPGPITDWNEQAAAARRRLLEAQLAGDQLVELRVAVPNRPGVVAQLALELGRAGVNIADLVLHPAPDMSEGVVALWLAGAATAGRAQGIIEDLGHPVFRP